MEWACMAANGTGSLVFIDDMTAEHLNKFKCYYTETSVLYSICIFIIACIYKYMVRMC